MLSLSTNRLLLAWATVACLAIAGCSGENDESDGTSDESSDVGVDVDEDMPSVESIDYESAEPSGPPARIHVESSSSRGVISEAPPLPAGDFLTQEQAEKIITGTDLETLQLSGQSASQTHNSVRYAPKGAEYEVFGVALQVWDVDDEEQSAEERIAELRDQFLNVDDVDVDFAPKGAFVSRRSGIRTLVFPAEEDPHVFVLSCDTDHCDQWDDLFGLGQEIAAGD